MTDCKRCGGVGGFFRSNATEWAKCPTCNGTGRIRLSEGEGAACDACNGKGTRDGE